VWTVKLRVMDELRVPASAFDGVLQLMLCFRDRSNRSGASSSGSAAAAAAAHRSSRGAVAAPQ
jgi:hypothetical protein